MKGKKELILKGNLIIGKLKSVQKENSSSLTLASTSSTQNDEDDVQNS